MMFSRGAIRRVWHGSNPQGHGIDIYRLHPIVGGSAVQLMKNEAVY